MLSRREIDLVGIVWGRAAALGQSAPAIADALIRDTFPQTATAAEYEGASSILRRGLISEVKRILRGVGGEEQQRDFHDIDPAFQSLAQDLHSNAYFVESLDQHVPIPQLIKEPALLDDARKFMRRKGDECIQEANRLDDLYRAVVGEA